LNVVKALGDALGEAEALKEAEGLLGVIGASCQTIRTHLKRPVAKVHTEYLFVRRRHSLNWQSESAT